MKKILYVPLDDRPCNYLYPSLIAKIADDIKLLTPPFSLMGKCKRAGNSALIWEWLFKEAPITPFYRSTLWFTAILYIQEYITALWTRYICILITLKSLTA